LFSGVTISKGKKITKTKKLRWVGKRGDLGYQNDWLSKKRGWARRGGR